MLEKPLMSVVAPVYASDIYGSAASFGAMLGAFGAGALVGTLAFSVVGHRLPRRLTFLTCMLLAPVVMFGSLAATPPLPALLAALAVSGVVFGPMNALFATAIQETAPTDLLGRDRHGLGALNGRSSAGGHGGGGCRGGGGTGRHTHRDGWHLPGSRGRHGPQPSAACDGRA